MLQWVFEGLHLVDKNGKPVANAVEGADLRAAGYLKQWEEDGTADVFEDVNIKCSEGVHVVIVGTARVYIYLA